jgi:hypothetical protein
MQRIGTSENSSSGLFSRWGACGVIALSGLGWSGCATQTAVRFSPADVAAMSPAAAVVKPFDAMRLGKKYVNEHAGTEFLVGSGDSMLPLYKDHTVVVTRQIEFSELRSGMTAVYIDESGRPVAHVLVKKTFEGWIAMGVGNAECDSTPVTKANLLGVVVKAFEPSRSPMLALLDEAALRKSVASMP